MLIEKSRVMIVPLQPPIFIRPPISLVKYRTVVGTFQLLGMELIEGGNLGDSPDREQQPADHRLAEKTREGR